MSKLWIDSDLLENKSGIGRDAKIMIEWLNEYFECEYVQWPEFLDSKSKYKRKFLMALRILFGGSVHLPSQFKGALYQSQLGPLLPGNNISLWIVRLHDLFPSTNPEWFNWWATKVFQKSLREAVDRKAIFLCDSASTEAVLKKLFKDQDLNSFVVLCRLPQTIPIPCSSCQACLNIDVAQKNRYFLSVGTIEPRKNYSFALSTWKKMVYSHENFPNLVIVGKPGWKTRRFQKELRRADKLQVLWFSDCCDGALEKLYKGAEAVISFSLAEGFDLPPMEARQRHQKPLILSDIPVHREFHEGAAKFFSNETELVNILVSPLSASSRFRYIEKNSEVLDFIALKLKSML